MTTFFERISFLPIIKNHASTLYNNSTGKIDIIECIILLTISFGGAFALCYFGKNISNDSISSLFSTFAIMGGFIFNALVLLATRKESIGAGGTNKEKNILITESFYNTAFGILLSILAVILCAIYDFFVKAKISINNAYINIDLEYQTIVSFFVYVICILFVHTMLMVLKRLNRIFSDDF